MGGGKPRRAAAAAAPLVASLRLCPERRESTCPVDLAGLASEWHTQWVSLVWDFVSLQGRVVPRLCGAKFCPCLVVGRGPVPNKVLWAVSWPAAPRPPATGGVSFHFSDGTVSFGVLLGHFSSVSDSSGFSQSRLLTCATAAVISCYKGSPFDRTWRWGALVGGLGGLWALLPHTTCGALHNSFLSCLNNMTVVLQIGISH